MRDARAADGSSRLRGWLGSAALVCVGVAACTTLPEPKHKHWDMPREIYPGTPDRPFEKIGPVRAKVTFSTLLDEAWNEQQLCQNYYRKAANVLLDMARKKGADAVIELRSVVFMMDGKMETHAKAECADDGDEGQVLAQGIAIKWKPPSKVDPGP